MTRTFLVTWASSAMIESDFLVFLQNLPGFMACFGWSKIFWKQNLVKTRLKPPLKIPGKLWTSMKAKQKKGEQNFSKTIKAVSGIRPSKKQEKIEKSLFYVETSKKLKSGPSPANKTQNDPTSKPRK
ncbi:hypothetical protein GQ457_17G016140 [Hibiscus cannabinus]